MKNEVVRYAVPRGATIEEHARALLDAAMAKWCGSPEEVCARPNDASAAAARSWQMTICALRWSKDKLRQDFGEDVRLIGMEGFKIKPERYSDN